MDVRDAVLDLLFPPKCPLCGRVIAEVGFCEQCLASAPRPEREDMDLRESGLHCAAPFRYEGAVRRALVGLKYSGHIAYARPFGEALAETLVREGLTGVHRVTWVPLGDKRLKSRGFDQAFLIARHAAAVFELPTERLLKKLLDTPPVARAASAAERRARVLGNYAALRPLSGERVLLIDDICTSGATMAECRRTLLAAGAGEVLLAAAALTPRTQSGGGKRN